jgi:tetratricopeptide (TPR) repeat protein
MTTSVPPARTPPLTSHRDRDVLRSFAQRIDPADAGAHNNLGVLYYNKGLHEEAVAAFMRALELDQKMQVAQRNLEIAYFNTGYYDKRIPELRERLRQHPEDREARWELGRTYALVGQQPQAIEEFTALLQYHPNDVGALLQLALAEKQAGDIGRAQEWLERALALDRDSSILHFYLGEVLYNRGLNDDALTALKRAMALNPENHDALYLMGFVLGDMGRHEEARDVTKRAIKLNPTFSRAQANLSLEQGKAQRYEEAVAAREERRGREMQVAGEGRLARYNLGLAFRQKNYLVEALREYRLALEQGEDRDLVLQAMAEVHILRKDPKAALELYEQLLTSQPNSPKLWNERGVTLHQDGRYDDAEASYRKAIAADSHYALAQNNLGIALYHRGDVEGSLAALGAAVEAQPSFAKARLNLALLLYKGKRVQKALEAYRQALTTAPEHPIAWNGIGLVLADLKKYEDAKNAFARAIQARPTYAEAHYNLSFTLSSLGDFEAALRETKLALEIDPYYVAQKFELAIDLQHEDPDLSIQPDLGTEKRADAPIEEFSFDAKLLDTLFTELAPAPAPATNATPEAAPYRMASDFLTKGMHDRAAAEIRRAMSRGASRAEGQALLGTVFAKQGLHGEALERYREARREAAAGDAPKAALIGEAWSLVRLGRAAEARPVAEELLAREPEEIEILMLAATTRGDAGDPAAALAVLETARRVAPARADVHQKIGDIARSLGDHDGAIGAYRHALALDQDFAVVRYQLARLLMVKGSMKEAEQELVAALDAVPTYAEATLELAALRQRVGRAADGLPLLIELLQRDPYHFDALIALGETLLSLGRKRDAVTAFSRVLRFDPAHVGALYHEGALLVEQKRYREAIARWERVIEHAPASEYAKRAKREMRTAADLARIFGERVPAEAKARRTSGQTAVTPTRS